MHLASKLMLAAVLVAGPQEGDKAPPKPPSIRLRLSSDPRLNPSKSMSVRFTIENATAEEIEIEEPADYLDGLEVLDGDGKEIRPFGKGTGAKRTLKLEKGAFVGRVVDIKPAIPEGKLVDGGLKLTWRHGGAQSNTIEPWAVKDWVATLDTTLGEIRLEFLPEAAPRHVLNFLDLARQKKFDGTTFHRVIPGFMAQAGRLKDPVKFTVKAEFNEFRHNPGTLSMARSDEPDSASTEFFICFTRIPGLDGKYTVFGQMVAGEATLKAIEKAATDHSPCQKCGRPLPPKPEPCCGDHHEDKPKVDIVIKKVTLTEKGAK